MDYEKYTDKLLAQQDNLPTDTIFKILIGYSWRELGNAEIANNSLKGKGSGSLPEGYTSTRETRVAGKAYSLLCRWIGIKFHNDPSGLNIGQSHNTEDFFNWLTEDKILEKLEIQIAGHKTPKRALEFIGYLNLSEVKEQDSVKKIEKTKNNILHAPDGTKWKDIKIEINNKAQIAIFIKKKRLFDFSLEKWKTVMTSKTSRDFLFRIIHLSGVFDEESFEDQQRTNYRQYLSKLRKDLKDFFNISENPFKRNRTSGHQTLFSCHSNIILPNESSDLLPEDNTPKGTKKQTDPYL
tara:strand:+ start:666 stop:1550 length:885 start_codon:yes stop_codon:yes gene_type:complete